MFPPGEYLKILSTKQQNIKISRG